MPPRRRSGRGGGRRVGFKAVVGIILAAVAIVCLATAAYYFYENRTAIKRFFARPQPPDAAAIEMAIREAYASIKPAKVSSSTVTVGGRQITQDRVELPKAASLARANAEITRAVESAGGEVAYGVESSDQSGRKVGVTLGVSIQKGLVREIRLEKSAGK
jgi:hypothetical protein